MDNNDLSLLWCKQYIDKRLNGTGNVDTSIKPGSVGTAELADGSVTLGKLAQEVLELLYQPGSLYINANDINPKELFGFGEWVQIKDRFILAAGDTYAAGSTGGEATHTLTVNEMPKHGHQVYIWNNNNQNFDAYTASPDGSTINLAPVGALNSSMQWQNSAFKTAGNDGLGIGNVNGSGDLSGVTHFVGGSQPHNNMPPYLAVYVWQRIK